MNIFFILRVGTEFLNNFFLQYSEVQFQNENKTIAQY